MLNTRLGVFFPPSKLPQFPASSDILNSKDLHEIIPLRNEGLSLTKGRGGSRRSTDASKTTLDNLVALIFAARVAVEMCE